MTSYIIASSSTSAIAESRTRPHTAELVRTCANLQYEELPTVVADPSKSALPALAACYFKTAQFVSGRLRLRPGVRMDTERVGETTHVCFVNRCEQATLHVRTRVCVSCALRHAGCCCGLARATAPLAWLRHSSRL